MRGTIPEDQGALLQVGIADPGAGNVLFIHTDLGRRWRVSGISIVLTTCPAGPNRVVYWYYWDGFVIGSGFSARENQPAALSKTYWFSPIPIASPAMMALNNICPISFNLLMNETMGIIITANGLQGGDAFTDCVVTGEQWLED